MFMSVHNCINLTMAIKTQVTIAAAVKEAF